MDLISICCSTKDRAYPEICYLYVLPGPEDPANSLRDIDPAYIYLSESQKLVSENRKKASTSRKSPIEVDTFCPDPTVSATGVSIKVHSVESETHVPDSIVEGCTNTRESMQVSDHMLNDSTDEVESIKAGFASSLVNALHINAENSVSVCPFGRENTKTLCIDTSLDQITKVPCLLRNVEDQQRQKLKVCMQSNEFDYGKGFHTRTP